MLDAIVRELPATDRGASPELLDVGFSSVVVAFGISVIRVARTRQAQEGHEREMRLLPWLDGRLNIDLAVPHALLAPGPALPFGAIIQPRLRGRAMTAEDGRSRDSAQEFGGLLASLHGLDHAAAPKGSIQYLNAVPYLHRVLRETESCLRTQLVLDEWTRLTTRSGDAESLLLGQEQVLCHGDAWYGNVLVDDDGHITALLDFEDACVADPALDLAATTYLDPPGPKRLLDAYLGDREPAPSLLVRVEAYLLLRELAGLAYILRNNINEELEDGIAKVRAVLNQVP